MPRCSKFKEAHTAALKVRSTDFIILCYVAFNKISSRRNTRYINFGQNAKLLLLLFLFKLAQWDWWQPAVLKTAKPIPKPILHLSSFVHHSEGYRCSPPTKSPHTLGKSVPLWPFNHKSKLLGQSYGVISCSELPPSWNFILKAQILPILTFSMADRCTSLLQCKSVDFTRPCTFHSAARNFQDEV